MLQQVMTNPGEITFREVPVPEVKDDQVLVKIRNIGICGSDIHVYHGKHPFTKYPVTQGHEVSGEIAEIGKNVSGFQIGQKVTIEPQVYCGHCYPCRHGKYNLCEKLKVMGFQTTGTASEYFAVDASKVTPIPEDMSYEEGAMIEPLAVAVHGVKQVGDVKGLNIAVLGAGPIGNLVAQAAKGMGAAKVMITDVSDLRLDKAKECLEAAGYSDSDGDGIVDKDGENLSLTISIANGSSTAVSETLQDMWKQIGVDVQIEMLENVSDKRASGDFDMLVSPNWQTVNAGDGQKYLMNRWSDGGSDNYSGYHSDEFQSVLDKLDAAFTQEDRVSAFVEAQQILADDAPAIWMYANDNVTLVNSKLENVTVFPIDYYLVTNKWTLAE